LEAELEREPEAKLGATRASLWATAAAVRADRGERDGHRSTSTPPSQRTGFGSAVCDVTRGGTYLATTAWCVEDSRASEFRVTDEKQNTAEIVWSARGGGGTREPRRWGDGGTGVGVGAVATHAGAAEGGRVREG
jgi:hypothetical protein